MGCGLHLTLCSTYSQNKLKASDHLANIPHLKRSIRWGPCPLGTPSFAALSLFLLFCPPSLEFLPYAFSSLKMPGDPLLSAIYEVFLALFPKTSSCPPMVLFTWSEVKVLVTQVSNSLQAHGPSRLLYPWNSPGKNTGLGSHSLCQGIFSTQGLNPDLLHCRWIFYWATREVQHTMQQCLCRNQHDSPARLGDSQGPSICLIHVCLHAPRSRPMHAWGLQWVLTTGGPSVFGRLRGAGSRLTLLLQTTPNQTK